MAPFKFCCPSLTELSLISALRKDRASFDALPFYLQHGIVKKVASELHHRIIKLARRLSEEHLSNYFAEASCSADLRYVLIRVENVAKCNRTQDCPCEFTVVAASFSLCRIEKEMWRFRNETTWCSSGFHVPPTC